MARNGKRLSQAYGGIDREKDYALAEAVKIVKDAASKTKFDETVDFPTPPFPDATAIIFLIPTIELRLIIDPFLDFSIVFWTSLVILKTDFIFTFNTWSKSSSLILSNKLSFVIIWEITLSSKILLGIGKSIISPEDSYLPKYPFTDKVTSST